MNQNLVVGLKNVKINTVVENNGQLQIVLQCKSDSAVCPTCKSPSKSIKQHRTHPIIDKPISPVPVHLFIIKRQFKCFNPSCPTKFFTEEIQGLQKKHTYTTEFENFIGNLFEYMDFPTIQNHLSKSNIFMASGSIWEKLKNKTINFQTSLQDIQNAKFIGLDEFSYATGHSFGVLSINIDKRKIADMVAGGRDQKTAEGALSIFNPAIVEACCIDMHLPFKNACYNKLPNAIVVVDKFHVIKLLNESIKNLIKRILPSLPFDDSQLKQFNKYGKWNILRANERLTDSQRTDLSNLLSLNQELRKIYECKELLRTIYKTIRKPDTARTKLYSWIHYAKSLKIPELTKTAQTYSDWFTCIFNYWHCRISNGITEGKVNKIKVFRKKAYHYRNFHTLRYQVLKSEKYNFKT